MNKQTRREPIGPKMTPTQPPTPPPIHLPRTRPNVVSVVDTRTLGPRQPEFDTSAEEWTEVTRGRDRSASAAARGTSQHMPRIVRASQAKAREASRERYAPTNRPIPLTGTKGSTMPSARPTYESGKPSSSKGIASKRERSEHEERKGKGPSGKSAFLRTAIERCRHARKFSRSERRKPY